MKSWELFPSRKEFAKSSTCMGSIWVSLKLFCEACFNTFNSSQKSTILKWWFFFLLVGVWLDGLTDIVWPLKSYIRMWSKGIEKLSEPYVSGIPFNVVYENNQDCDRDQEPSNCELIPQFFLSNGNQLPITLIEGPDF